MAECTHQVKRHEGLFAVHSIEHTSHFIFVILCCCIGNLVCLPFLILKMHAKRAIKLTLTMIFCMLQETKDLGC